jgi:tetratricopeptide (TPR) repeat protein
MYLSGSKWQMTKTRHKRSRPWRVLGLLVLLAAMVYLWQIVVPTVPPLLIPTATPTRSPVSYVLEAENLFAAGKLEQAIDSYRDAIAVDPQNVAYYIAMARVQVFAGLYGEAETSARSALLIDPNSALAHAVLGWSLDFNGNLIDAQREVERALEIDPNLALGYAYYAEILADVDLYDEGAVQARRSLEVDPGLLEGHRALGYVYEKVGRYADAQQQYLAALAINPNLPLLHIALGNMYRAQGEINAAIDSFTRASSLLVDDPTPLLYLAQTYASVGEYGKASQYAADALRTDPGSARLHGNLGRMYYHNNELDLAIDELSLAVRGGQTADGVPVEGLALDPGDTRVVEYYYTYGLALAKLARCDEAVAIFNALIRGVPDDDIAQANALEGLTICGQPAATATPEVTATPAAQ